MRLIFITFVLILSMGFAFAQTPPPVPPGQPEWNIAGTSPNQQLGAAVAGVGDVNGDGIGDVAVGELAPSVPGSTIPPRVTIRDGSTGQIIYVMQNQVTGGSGFGSAIEGIGDVDGDNIPDIAVGAYGGAALPNGGIYVFSSQTSALLWSFLGTGGSSDKRIVSMGDINNNNIPDFIVKSVPSLGTATIFAFDGTGNLPLYTITGQTGLSSSLANVGDIDGDNVNDFISGVQNIGVGAVDIYSGINGAVIGTISDTTPGGIFGRPVASGDVNNDGILDFIVGEFISGFPPMSNAYVFSGQTGYPYLYTINNIPALISLASLNDANGDGSDDFLIGSPQSNQVFLYSGQTGALLYTFNAPPPLSGFSGLFFGGAIADAGDINLDGLSDMIIGDYSSPSATAGQVGMTFAHRLGGVKSYGTGSSLLRGLPQLGNPSLGQFQITGAASNSNGLIIISSAYGFTPLPAPLTPVFVDLSLSNLIYTNTVPLGGSGTYTSPVFGIRNPAIAGTRIYIQVANTDSSGNVIGLTNPLLLTFLP